MAMAPATAASASAQKEVAVAQTQESILEYVSHEKFLPRIVSLLHFLNLSSQYPFIHEHLARQCHVGWVNGSYSSIAGLDWGRGSNWENHKGPEFLQTLYMSNYPSWPEFEKNYWQIIGLVTSFLINFEKAVCFDAALLAGSRKEAPSPSNEDNIGYWKDIFSGGDNDAYSTFPIDKGYSVGGDEYTPLKINTCFGKRSHFEIRYLSKK